MMNNVNLFLKVRQRALFSLAFFMQSLLDTLAVWVCESFVPEATFAHPPLFSLLC